MPAMQRKRARAASHRRRQASARNSCAREGCRRRLPRYRARPTRSVRPTTSHLNTNPLTPDTKKPDRHRASNVMQQRSRYTAHSLAACLSPCLPACLPVPLVRDRWPSFPRCPSFMFPLLTGPRERKRNDRPPQAHDRKQKGRRRATDRRRHKSSARASCYDRLIPRSVWSRLQFVHRFSKSILCWAAASLLVSVWSTSPTSTDSNENGVAPELAPLWHIAGWLLLALVLWFFKHKASR